MRLNRIFTSHMVLPAHKPLRVYGEGAGSVQVFFNGQSVEGHFATKNWCVKLPPMVYGGPYRMRVLLNGKETVLEDVCIGEVYLFAGQSNMQFKLKESTTVPSDCSANAGLRLYSTDRLEHGEHGDHFTSADGWVTCERETVGEWSALGYLTGNELTRRKNVAIGVIACYQGASVIESWLPAGTVEELGIHVPISSKGADHTNASYRSWNGKDGTLYEQMFGQVKPFALSGVVWYQGESDISVEEAGVYRAELAALITRWRADLRDTSLPFVVVQISDYTDTEGWRLLQKAQAEISEQTEGVKTVISRDVCEVAEIHPPTKDKLAMRIADALCGN